MTNRRDGFSTGLELNQGGAGLLLHEAGVSSPPPPRVSTLPNPIPSSASVHIRPHDVNPEAEGGGLGNGNARLHNGAAVHLQSRVRWLTQPKARRQGSASPPDNTRFPAQSTRGG
ncbi:unnamed protein product [Arctogadus glacialis]